MLERIDRYELKERVGVGGQATVYLAEDTVLERQVAVKVMNQIVSEEEAFADRFMTEARLAANLIHRNIATVYDFKIENNYACIVMEYLPNSVDKILHKNGALPPPRASQIAIHTAEALEHAHTNGFVHRDIKPHNILISPEGMAKVTDFGIARASDLISTTDTVGTPIYMSPEQCRRENSSDIRSDIYSLGVTFYEMLSGHPPFQGSYQELIESHLNQQPPPFESSLNIPKSLESIVMKCLAKDPGYRYQTAHELSTTLRALFGGTTPQDTPITTSPESTTPEMATTPPPTQNSNQFSLPVEVILKPSKWSKLVAAMSLAAAVIFLIVNSEKVLNQFRNLDELVPGKSESVFEGDKQVPVDRSPEPAPVVITQSSIQPRVSGSAGKTAPKENVEALKEPDIENADISDLQDFSLVKIDELAYLVEFPWPSDPGLSHISKVSLFEANLGQSNSITLTDLEGAEIENVPDDVLVLRSLELNLKFGVDENIFTVIAFDLNKEWLESESIDLDRIVFLAKDGGKWLDTETYHKGMSMGPSNQYYERFESGSAGLSVYLIAISD